MFVVFCLCIVYHTAVIFGYRNEGEEIYKGMEEIMVVDDEPSVRLLVGSILGNDYKVQEASDGAQALEIASNHHLGLILMDISMPGVDGYTACSALRNNLSTRDIPVLMITGDVHEVNRKLEEQMGVVGYITKPFDCQDLRDKVKQVLDGCVTVA